MKEGQRTTGRWIARIAVALAAAILMIGLGLHQSVQDQIARLLDSVGTNIFQVTSNDAAGFTDQTIAQLTSLAEVGDVAGAGSTRTGYAPDAVYSLTYFEVSCNYADVMHLPFSQGRGFSGNAGQVAVLGAEVARVIYGDKSPIGEILEGLAIIGVLERIPEEDTVREALNRRILVPLGLAPGPSRSSRQGKYSVLWVRSSSSMSRAASAIMAEIPGTQIVRLSDRYAWGFSAEIQANRFLLIATTALLLLAGIVVAGTLSLAAVARRWEIGVRMAIGANRLDVLKLLLFDSARITMEGCVLGMIAGLAITIVAEQFSIAIALGGTQLAILPSFALLGLFSGFLPALHASRLYPAQALAVGASNHRGGSRHTCGFSIVVVSSAIVASAIYIVLTFGASTARTIDTLWGDVDQRTLLVSAPRESILSPPMLVPDDLSILLTQSSIDIAVSAIRQPIRAIPGSERMGIVLTGVGPGYERLHLLYISSGRDLTANEISTNAHSVVINTDIANDVFEDEDAVGQIIRLDGRAYTVVGVFSSYMPVISAGIWMVAPLGSLKSWDEAISEALFWVKLTDEAAINVAAQDIVASFRERYPDKADVRAVAPTQMTDEIRKEVMRLVYLLGLIAGASALLGTTDVFNLVQVQLEQRRMELAIRRAVGSSNSQIALLGVLQGLRVAMFATPVGLASGIAGMALLANAMAMNLSVLSGRYLSLVTLIFIAIGAMSGGAAGWRASRGTPAEALRKGRA